MAPLNSDLRWRSALELDRIQTMRPLKIFGIVVGGLLVLVAAAAIGVLLSVDPNAYRGDIERLVQQKTGRHLAIGGKLDLKLFPYLAISISEVQLGNAPGYGQAPFLTVHQASVGVRLLPILRKRLEVSRVSIDGLTASLASRSATDNNWKDLTTPKGNTGRSDAGSGVPQTSIAGVEVTNASLQYRDESRKTLTSISNLRLHTGAVGGREPVDVAVELDYGDGGSKPVAHIALSALVQADAAPRIALRNLDVHGILFASEPSTGPLTFSLRSPAVQLDTQAQTLSPAMFMAQAGEVSAKLSVTADKLFTDRLVSGTLSVPEVGARKAFESLGIALPATRDPKALSAFSLSGDYRLTPKQLQLTNLDLALDDTHVRGSAAVVDLDTMALEYALKVDRINADRYLAPKGAPRPSGQPPASGSKSDASTTLPSEALRKLDVQGTLEVGQVTLGGINFTGMSLPLTAKGGRVHLGPTQARMLGGAYNGDIVLDAAPAQARVSLNEHVKSVDVGALMKAAFDTTRISGHGDADVVAAGTGNTYDSILRSLDGKIEFNVKEGALNGVDLSYELQSAQALLQKQLPPARSGPARTLFNTFSGSANLDKGVLRNDDLSIESDYLKTHGKGTLDLGTKRGAIAAIDYRLVASVYKLPRGASGAQEKAADIPLRLTGNLGNLKIRPDLEALAAARVRQEVNDRLQGKQDELRKKLGDKLKDLLGR
jgi:AsmA protein